MISASRLGLRTLLVPLAMGVLYTGCDDATHPTPRTPPPPRAALAGSSNPILKPDAPDPHVAYLGGKYWIYPTAAPDSTKCCQEFHAFSSTDLVNWKDEGVVLSLSSVSWAKDNGWAPAIAYRNGKYYFYFSAGGPYNRTTDPADGSKIGVAVADSPAGPFTDIGTPLVLSDSEVEAIDPMVFIDDNGKAYLYYGGSARSNLAIHELGDNMTTVGPRTVLTPPHFTEAPFMHKRNGIYYMSYSNGAWDTPGYNVRYATAPDPKGPWQYRGQILAQDYRYWGPGHHSILQIPGTDQWYIVYHRYENSTEFYADPKRRAAAIEPLYYNDNGSIQPVLMTPAEPPLAGGTYKLVAKHSGKALDVAGCSTADGADVITWPYWGGDCQQWRIETAP